jgi:hypothetical protein
MNYDDDVYDTFNERLSNMVIYDIADDTIDDRSNGSNGSNDSNDSNGSNDKRLFSENYLHELPADIQMDIMVLSQKTYRNIVIKCVKHILNFDRSVISKKLNRHMRKFVFTIRDIEYINNKNKKVIERYRCDISKYVDKLQNSLVSHINKFIKHYSINYIRNILCIDDLEEYGSYEKELYTTIILKSYILNFIEI